MSDALLDLKYYTVERKSQSNSVHYNIRVIYQIIFIVKTYLDKFARPEVFLDASGDQLPALLSEEVTLELDGSSPDVDLL